MSCTPDPTCTSTLSIRTTASTQPGSYPITVTGTNALTDATNSAVYTLAVTSPYVQITLNPGSTISGTFQQNITFNPSTYSAYESGDLGNIRFYSSMSGNVPSGPLDSWLEGCPETACTQSSSHAIFWVKLPNGEAPGENIYMVFGPTSGTGSEFDGSIAGEAPQLSGQSYYGQYDNGGNVFTYYSRFGGSSLPSGWSGFGYDYSLTYGTTYLTITTTDTGSTYGGIYTTTQIPTIPSVYEFYGNIYTSTSSSGYFNFAGILDTSSPSINPYAYSAYVIQVGSRPDWDIVGDNNGYYYDTGYADQNIAQVYGLAIPSSTSAQFFYNYASTAETTGLTSETLDSFIYTGSGGSPEEIYWYRVRAYPPNGVMPGYSFGSVQ